MEYEGKKSSIIKKFCSLAFMLVLFMTFHKGEYLNAATQEKGEEIPGRIINVVYDDSGSMYINKKIHVDTWCQAKYSMEVFAAMLGENDVMNVYYMSDYDKGKESDTPRIVLHGSDGASVNVRKIHEEKTKSGNTPFKAVKKAYQDLDKETASEKWLVILTDGEFEDVDAGEADSFLGNKRNDVNVMFLAIGADAAGISENQNKNIFFVKADNSTQVLKEITGICNRIFNTDKLDVNVSTKTFSFDVPMSELIVFAQGANVEINGIKSESGNVYKSSKLPVEVKYSECDATKYQNEPTRNLQGSIATFKDDFSAGNYVVNVSGAETIEIYYKPNVEVEVSLMDLNGNEVTDMEKLEAGDYIINMGMVKTGTKEKVKESKLLGTITYVAGMTINGETDGNVYSNGSKICLPEGMTVIDASATYLGYHRVETERQYQVFKNRGISFEVTSNPEYIIDSGEFDNSKPIVIKVKIDGRECTSEEWNAMEIPLVTLKENSSREFEVEGLRIEKTEIPGVFNIVPILSGGKPSPDAYSDCEYTLKYEQQFENGYWTGGLNSFVDFKETRFWDKSVTYKTLSSPNFNIQNTGFNAEQFYEVKAELDGRDISYEEWKVMDLPTVSLANKDYDFEIGTPVIKATDNPGVYRIYPTLPNGVPSSGTYDDIEFSLSYRQSFKYETWSGSTSGGDMVFDVTDGRSWLDRNKDLVKKLIFLGILLFFILGYLPFIKNYLPKALKAHPQVVCVPDEPGDEERTLQGFTHKYLFSTIIPYRAQRGKAQFLPNGRAGLLSEMQLKALRGKNMAITNLKDYRNHEDFTINNRPVTDKTNNSFHSIKTCFSSGGWSYNCNLFK